MLQQTTSRHAGAGFVITIGAIAALGPLAIDMYLPSIIEMAADLETSYSQMQLSLTVFLLAMGAGQLLFGPLIDAVGRRRPLLAGLVLYVLMAGGAAAAPSLEMLIDARVAQGVAAALLLVVAMSSVRDIAEGVRAAQIFAMPMTIEGLAPILAPVAGGMIGGSFGWRGVLLALGLLGVLVLLNAAVNFSETLPRSARAPLSLRSALRTYGEIIRDVDFVLPGIALTGAFFFLFAYVGGAGYAYQSDFGLSVEAFGFVFGGTGVAVLLGAMLAGRLVARIRIQTLAVAGVSLMCLGSFVALIAGSAGAGLTGGHRHGHCDAGPRDRRSHAHVHRHVGS
ncbi:MFS transporter [Falsirhodobacter deserti]|uniref:MFS transporter n=1 Tax=Falsirhodobacter deserti TaxID=1365611 RepID=UPI0019D4126F|nr:MFS transporter [Falsirhodobacter deserti]